MGGNELAGDFIFLFRYLMFCRSVGHRKEIIEIENRTLKEIFGPKEK
jgi:hypothetical protein